MEQNVSFCILTLYKVVLSVHFCDFGFVPCVCVFCALAGPKRKTLSLSLSRTQTVCKQSQRYKNRHYNRVQRPTIKTNGWRKHSYRVELCWFHFFLSFTFGLCARKYLARNSLIHFSVPQIAGEQTNESTNSDTLRDTFLLEYFAHTEHRVFNFYIVPISISRLAFVLLLCAWNTSR